MKKLFSIALFFLPLITSAQQNSFQVQSGILYDRSNSQELSNFGSFSLQQTNKLSWHYGLSYTNIFWENTSIRYGLFWNEEKYNILGCGCWACNESNINNRFIELPIFVKNEFGKKRFFVEYGISPYIYLKTTKISNDFFVENEKVAEKDLSQSKIRFYFNNTLGYQLQWKEYIQFFTQAEIQARSVDFVPFDKGINSPKPHFEMRFGVSLGIRYLLKSRQSTLK